MWTRQDFSELNKRIDAASKKYKRAKAAAVPRPAPVVSRCRPDNSVCVMVYILAGRLAGVAADFVLGRGWGHRWQRRGRRRFEQCSDRKHLLADIEEAYARAPVSAVAALAKDPFSHFEFDELLCAHKYVMEHRLAAWIAVQNVEHSVAPSREQVLAQIPMHIAAEAPPKIRKRLRSLAFGAPRKQRKWLARFRRRWGCSFGVLRPQNYVLVEERRSKAGRVGQLFCGFKAFQCIMFFVAVVKKDFWSAFCGPESGSK